MSAIDRRLQCVLQSTGFCFLFWRPWLCISVAFVDTTQKRRTTGYRTLANSTWCVEKATLSIFYRSFFIRSKLDYGSEVYFAAKSLF